MEAHEAQGEGEVSYSQALEEQLNLTRYLDSHVGHHRLKVFAGSDDAASYYQGLIRSALDIAEPFYWSPSISDIIASTWASMPDWMLTDESLPSEAGLFWFSQPLKVPCPGDHDDEDDRLTAILWHRFKEDRSALMIFPLMEHTERASGIFVANVLWQTGQQRSAAIEWNARQSGQRPEMTCAAAFRASVCSIFAACLAFMDQRILVAPQQRAERHTRKRLERDGFKHEPLVRVVELRRKQARSDHHGEPEPVEWSHQWIVSGHWRQQWYPSLNANQPRWIMPYVKGPEDKPLKPPRAKVFAVVR